MVTGLSINILILRSLTAGRTIFTEMQEGVQASQEISLYFWILISLINILIIAGVLFYKKIIPVPKWISSKSSTFEKIISSNGELNEANFYKTIEDAGYLYDEKQDIFYSSMDPWQKKMGYCSFYDEAAILSGMIIDCEPVKFMYEGKEWLIEFWKGQYGLCTGCEIGVYIKDDTERNIAAVFKGDFFRGVNAEDRLQMCFSLKKMDKVLFTRNDKHWWLTGFKVGEFTEPKDLIMNLTITLKDFIMRDAFVKALKDIGYLKNEIFIDGKTVSLTFSKPRTQQPGTRIEELDWITQKKNKILCDKFEDITKGYNNFPDKVEALKDKAPEVYYKIANMGKSKELFRLFEKVEKT